MRAVALSRAFADTLGPLNGRAPAHPSDRTLVGVEQEFAVLRGGERIDFAVVIDRLDLGRRHLDPGDAHARRLPSGAALTCDGTEAEVALPPVAVAPGFAAETASRLEGERGALLRRLGVGHELVGSSTHISVSVWAGLRSIDAVAQLWARTFAPALMLLLDRRDSYGIYIRPRPGRLELCGEYATGDRLRAALVFAAGSVRATVGFMVSPAAAQEALPPVLRMGIEPCADRFGYTVHRRCFDGDLYRSGRDAVLTACDGMPTTAQRQLELAWAAARAALQGTAGPEEVDAVNRVVAAATRLPVAADEDSAGGSLDGPQATTAFGRVAQVLQRPSFEMAAVMVTWDAVVLVAAEPARRRTAFVCVPRHSLDAFVTALDAGALDGIIASYLRTRSAGRRLDQRRQLRAAGLYDALGSRRALLPREPVATRTATGMAA